MNFWSKNKKEIYEPMIKRHRDLWKFVENFIKEKNIKSVLEVGCGKIQLTKKLVPIYQCVDINNQTDAIHEDFTKMDTSSFKCDLLLACGVIEHCNGYSKFLEQIKRIRPKYAIVSFFNKLSWKDDYMMESAKAGAENKFWWNRYSQKKIEEKLKELGLSYSFIVFSKRDIVLVINFI